MRSPVRIGSAHARHLLGYFDTRIFGRIGRGATGAPTIDTPTPIDDGSSVDFSGCVSPHAVHTLPLPLQQNAQKTHWRIGVRASRVMPAPSSVYVRVASGVPCAWTQPVRSTSVACV